VKHSERLSKLNWKRRYW